jgi:DNA-binding NarL/FixJ family response regulator
LSTVLIVDDDPSIRALVGLVAEDLGCSTVEAETGEGALTAAAESQPALVVLDVHLPGISGYEVCRQLRERFGMHMPIIFLSGARTEAHDRVAGLLIGANDYVVKPFSPDELGARMRGLLARSGGVQPVGEGGGEFVRLTDRELEVLKLLARGLPQKAIASELYISTKTVATHIQRILTKLGVHSRAEAVAQAFLLGLVRADAPLRVP